VARPVLISRGVEWDVVVYCGEGEEREKGVGGEGVVMSAWTVASSLPLMPYVGDQMSSSTSWRCVMANNAGSLCVERVSVSTAVGYAI
jgi:hypothetical protein